MVGLVCLRAIVAPLATCRNQYFGLIQAHNDLPDGVRAFILCHWLVVSKIIQNYIGCAILVRKLLYFPTGLQMYPLSVTVVDLHFCGLFSYSFGNTLYTIHISRNLATLQLLWRSFAEFWQASFPWHLNIISLIGTHKANQSQWFLQTLSSNNR